MAKILPIVAALSLYGCKSEEPLAAEYVGESINPLPETNTKRNRDVTISYTSPLGIHLGKLLHEYDLSFDSAGGYAGGSVDVAHEWSYVLIPGDDAYEVRRLPRSQGIGGAGPSGLGGLQNSDNAVIQYGFLDLDSGELSFFTTDQLIEELCGERTASKYGLLLSPDSDGHYRLPRSWFPMQEPGIESVK